MPGLSSQWSVEPRRGGTENARPENTAQSKLQDWKTREKAYMESQTCYNFDTHVWIFIFFGRNVTDKVGNQQTLYYATLSNLCFRTTWQNAETRKSYFTQLDCVTHNAPVRYLSERKNVICDEFDSV